MGKEVRHINSDHFVELTKKNDLGYVKSYLK